MNTEYRNHQNVVHVKNNMNEIKEDPEKYGYTEKDFEKVTVPNQTMTVKEIMSRYEKRKPVPEE